MNGTLEVGQLIITGPKHIVNFKKTKQHVHLKRKKSVVYEFLRL